MFNIEVISVNLVVIVVWKRFIADFTISFLETDFQMRFVFLLVDISRAKGAKNIFF
jgi:hypothetical protein